MFPKIKRKLCKLCRGNIEISALEVTSPLCYHCNYWTLIQDDPDSFVCFSSFCPGFCHDLTSWRVFVFSDNLVVQLISPYKNDLPERMLQKVSQDKVQAIKQKLPLLDLEGIKLYNKLTSIDDIPFLRLQRYEDRQPIDLNDMSTEYFIKHNKDKPPELVDRAVKAAETFFDLWDSIDAITPYSNKTHAKKKK